MQDCCCVLEERIEEGVSSHRNLHHKVDYSQIRSLKKEDFEFNYWKVKTVETTHFESELSFKIRGRNDTVTIILNLFLHLVSDTCSYALIEVPL